MTSLSRFKGRKKNIDPKRLKVKPSGVKPKGLLKMQVTGYSCFPKLAVENELANAIRKRYLQERMHQFNTTGQQKKLYTSIQKGKEDDSVDLYMDELTELVKAKIREHSYWKF